MMKKKYRSTTKALTDALRVINSDIQGGDGTVNAVLFEAALRLDELDKALREITPVIRRIRDQAPGPTAYSFEQLDDIVKSLEDNL